MSVGRNDPCPCGSGKKYKKCCLKEGENSKVAAIGKPLTVEQRPYPSKRLVAALCLAIGLATLAVYARTFRHGFIALDDDYYVYENSMVKAGLTTSGFTWALTTFSCTNWHPLTWLSHMLDIQLFGLNAGAHHLVNVAFHVASSLLLFLALVRMTRQTWRSVLVAAIFAIHPLHVESVAWIAERKDVLSAFFAMLTLLLYVRYAEAPTAGRYLSMALAFALGLTAKPMLVTLPFVLLLLDFWPLRRIDCPPTWPALKRLLWEKTPLLGTAAVSGVLTFLAQKREAMVSLATLPFSVRLANVCVAYVSYVKKAFWPADLAVLYPYAASPGEDALKALVILFVVTFTFLLLIRRRPYLLVGWLWYVGMLVPVIGLIQVGFQSIADRYMYLPLGGLSIAVVWGAADLLENLPVRRTGRRFLQHGTTLLAGAALFLFARSAYQQVGYWKDSRTLFERTLAITKRNYVIHNNLGSVLVREGRHKEAIDHFREALLYSPFYANAHFSLGQELVMLGKFDEAMPHLTQALQLDSSLPIDRALTEVLQLKPDLPDAHANLGVVLAAKGKWEEARRHLAEALRFKPEDPTTQSNLCYVLQRLGRLDEAITYCAEALRLKPDALDARFNLGTALAAQGKRAEAAAELSRVLAANPNHPGARAVLEQLQGRGR